MNSEQLNKQEPKAWLVKEDGVTRLHWSKPEHGYEKCEPLYTAPPKREWQGLTDEEIFDVIRSLCIDNETAEMLIHVSMDEYRAIEAKLKEKNNG